MPQYEDVYEPPLLDATFIDKIDDLIAELQNLSAPSATNVSVDATGMDVITATNAQGALKQLDTAVDALDSNLAQLEWGADINSFSKTSLTDFQNSFDTKITSNGMRFGYIGASDSANIGLPNQGHYCILLSNSANYRIIVTISANGDRIKMNNKANGTWTTTWKNVSLT